MQTLIELGVKSLLELKVSGKPLGSQMRTVFYHLNNFILLFSLTLGIFCVCIRVGHKAGPCTATFNDLLCFGDLLTRR
jgi:hypothetical protein